MFWILLSGVLFYFSAPVNPLWERLLGSSWAPLGIRKFTRASRQHDIVNRRPKNGVDKANISIGRPQRGLTGDEK